MATASGMTTVPSLDSDPVIERRPPGARPRRHLLHEGPGPGRAGGGGGGGDTTGRLGAISWTVASCSALVRAGNAVSLRGRRPRQRGRATEVRPLSRAARTNRWPGVATAWEGPDLCRTSVGWGGGGGGVAAGQTRPRRLLRCRLQGAEAMVVSVGAVRMAAKVMPVAEARAATVAQAPSVAGDDGSVNLGGKGREGGTAPPSPTARETQRRNHLPYTRIPASSYPFLLLLPAS